MAKAHTTFMNDKPIEAEVVGEHSSGTQALALRKEAGALSARPMTVDELKENLRFIREVMQNVMAEGQDYGRIPGCGEKPTLLQPGAQKLCMTFQLQDRVKKEEVRDLAGGHREYSFTICLVSATGKEWDGVGTCSTMESKYRYRKAERRCPICGHNTIIQGKAEYGGGWLCYKKKGGCGAKFAEDAEKIVSQPGGTVEYENPADYWNTVRKMAFKRALVHAAINATNTSELWTQDVEEMAENRPPEGFRNASESKGWVCPSCGQTNSGWAKECGRCEKPKDAPEPKKGCPDTTQPLKTSPAASKAQEKAIPFPTEDSRKKMINALKANPGEPNRDICEEYFRKLENPAQLMPNESLEDLPLRFVPATTGQMRALLQKIAEFGDQGLPASAAFPPHPEPDKPAPEVKKPAAAQETGKDPLWWRDVIISVPPKGMKRDDYMKRPDTIGALYDIRHGNDEAGQAARQRLWGMCKWEPKPREYKGKIYDPTDADRKSYEALQAFAAWFAVNHPDEKL